MEFYMKENNDIIKKFNEESEFENTLEIKFPAISENEKLARNIVASMLIDKNPSIEVLSDIKTAVSEAVTNSVVHGYQHGGGECKITAKLMGKYFYIKIEDFGVGIKDIEQARQPFFTTGTNGDRSGMGFTVMETFMDQVAVSNQLSGSGLVVEMVKDLQKSEK